MFLSFVSDWLDDITKSYKLQLEMIDAFLKKSATYEDIPLSHWKLPTYTAFINFDRIKKLPEEELYKAFVLNRGGDRKQKTEAFFNLLNGVDFLSIKFNHISNVFQIFDSNEKEIRKEVISSYERLKKIGIENPEELSSFFEDMKGDPYMEQFVKIMLEDWRKVENPKFKDFKDKVIRLGNFTSKFVVDEPGNIYAKRALLLVEQLIKDISHTHYLITSTSNQLEEYRISLANAYDEVKNSVDRLNKIESVGLFKLV